MNLTVQAVRVIERISTLQEGRTTCCSHEERKPPIASTSEYGNSEPGAQYLVVQAAQSTRPDHTAMKSGVSRDVYVHARSVLRAE